MSATSCWFFTFIIFTPFSFHGTSYTRQCVALQVMFAKFSTWCSDTKADKEEDIKGSQLAITQFKAQIEAAQAEAEQAQANIDDAVSVQEKMKADIEAITKVGDGSVTNCVSVDKTVPTLLVAVSKTQKTDCTVVVIVVVRRVRSPRTGSVSS